eukprot:s2531_g17.t1
MLKRCVEVELPFLSSCYLVSPAKMIAKHFLNSHCVDSQSTATKDSRRKFRRRHSLSYKQIEAWDSESSEEDRVDRSGTCFIWLKLLF